MHTPARLRAEDVAAADALGRVLAQDVTAPVDLPPFANSAMDGFAIRSGPRGRRLTIVGESRAGAPADRAAGDGEAIRISTGAMLPAGADAVIQIELVERRRRRHRGRRRRRPRAQRARRRARTCARERSSSGAGRRSARPRWRWPRAPGCAILRCARRPRVAILATGDELSSRARRWAPGQIHDSNAPMLAALARQAGAERPVARGRRRPRRDDQRGARGARRRRPLLVLSGGVSVGPHDHVKPALAANGVEEVFWRVALRPGKPTWFGVRDADGTLVLGLPGNPVSAYVTFVLFAAPALAALQGADPRAKVRAATLAVAVERHRRSRRVRARAHRRRRPGDADGPAGLAHALLARCDADALAIVPAGTRRTCRGHRSRHPPAAMTRVLLTGATGYVGGQLLPALLERGHDVRALTRDPARARLPAGVEVVAGDVVAGTGLDEALDGVEVALYLVHSMGTGAGAFADADRRGARAFAEAARRAGTRRVVYLGGLQGESEHLRSREEVADVLREQGPALVHARAAMVIGAGGASFVMMSKLVERLPAMVCPRWIDTRSQPIAIRDVVGALAGLVDRDDAPEDVELGGADVLTYREMMRRYARVAGPAAARHRARRTCSRPA